MMVAQWCKWWVLGPGIGGYQWDAPSIPSIMVHRPSFMVRWFTLAIVIADDLREDLFMQF
jgi:hypothetical protein